ALLSCPYRASVLSRFTDTRDRFTRSSPNTEISCIRSMARAIAVPVDFVGGVSVAAPAPRPAYPPGPPAGPPAPAPASGPRTASRTRSNRCRAARPGSPRPPTAPPAGRPPGTCRCTAPCRSAPPCQGDARRTFAARSGRGRRRQEEEPLQLGARGSLAEGPVGSGLLISHKFHRHGQTVAALRVRSTVFPKLP